MYDFLPLKRSDWKTYKKYVSFAYSLADILSKEIIVCLNDSFPISSPINKKRAVF